MFNLRYKISLYIQKKLVRIINRFLFLGKPGSRFLEKRYGKYYGIKCSFKNLGDVLIYHRGTSADRGVISQILINKDYEVENFKQSAWLDSALDIIYKSGLQPLIIDAGANIGLSSLYFKDAYPSAAIKSIEPAASNIDLMKLNCVNGIDIFHGAINSDFSEIELNDPGEGEWGFSTHKARTKEYKLVQKVKCYKFSDFSAPSFSPFILKVDIEGGEKNEFLDVAFINQFALIIVELHDWLYPGEKTSRSFLEMISEIDFDFVQRGENIFLFNRKYMPDIN